MFVIMVYDAGERRNSKVLKGGKKVPSLGSKFCI